MTTGITSHLHRSVTSLPYRAALRQTRSIARVHAVGLRHTNLEGPMLGRAVVEKSDRAAANQRPGITSRNKDLAKQRFHSSSPTAKPGKNCSITDMMKGQKSSRVLSGSSNLTRPTAEPKSQAPLQNRSLNTLSRGDSQLPSMITSSSDPFKEPEVVDLTENRPLSIPRPYGGHGTSAAMPGVEFDPDDFSDDETLDFDAPFSPPDLPRINRVTKGPAREPPQNTASSTLTWSQSSFSHHQPPAAVKRESPVDPVAVAPATKKVKREVPPAVKRELPWLSKEKSEPVSTVKASKDKKERQPWNINASDAKAQMKQLKQKASTSVKDDLNLEHMHEAMKSNAPKKNSVIKLSDEQEHVKSLVIDQGQSVFFTGPAGTGKSVLMRSIISDLKKKYARDPERVAVTASTGLAACNIGGMTLHSFSGIGLGKEDAQALVKKIRRNPKAKNRWLKTKILVIDEISMVDGDLFDKLSQIGRIIRNNGRPWGGIQLVITGDFFQLPPVPDGNKQRDVKFAFDAGTWNLSIDHTIGLTQVFRQKDPDFAEMLNEMRLGKITERTVQNFQALARPLEFNDGLEVTELFPTRNEVENSNRKRLQALKGESHHYAADDSGKVEGDMRAKLLANMMAPPTLELKKGAQVMLIKNMDETLVNGSLGTVEDFVTEASLASRDGDDSDVEMDKKKSRIRAFTNALESQKGNTTKYPLVRFHAVDGSSRELLCVPEDWKVELPNGEIQASRKQLPLILAWALSIHKAQGQTLERVKVDLGKVFEKGQAYVALSRATSQQGLQVLGFRKDKVMAHPRVIIFYDQLYSAEQAMQKKAATSITSFLTKQPPSKTAPAPAKKSAGSLLMREKKMGAKERDEYGFCEDDEEAMAAYG